MILLSWNTKTIIVAKLTVPWEEKLATSHHLKKAKYQDLIDEAALKEWPAMTFPIEVSCRGFPAKSVRHFLLRIGLEPKQLKIATREIATVAKPNELILGTLPQAKANQPSHSGEVYRLRGETHATLRYLLTMRNGFQ